MRSNHPHLQGDSMRLDKSTGCHVLTTHGKAYAVNIFTNWTRLLAAMISDGVDDPCGLLTNAFYMARDSAESGDDPAYKIYWDKDFRRVIMEDER